MSSTTDKIKGTANDAMGKVKEGLGKGDRQTELAG